MGTGTGSRAREKGIRQWIRGIAAEWECGEGNKVERGAGMLRGSHCLSEFLWHALCLQMTS